MTINIEKPLERFDSDEVFYPDSDGERMADNTLQFEWIVTIKGGLERLFHHDPDVFVAGDLLWYPVRGDNRTRLAPDAMVVFGRPKGYRGSYQQWREDGIAPQVVFEVLSPGNTTAEMANKRQWYARYGVEEYYEYDPDHGTLRGWLLQGITPVEIAQMQGWVSPRLNVLFGLEGTDLVLIGPDGIRFQSFIDIATERDALAIDRDEIATERDREREERQLAETRAASEYARAERLAARLRALGISEE